MAPCAGSNLVRKVVPAAKEGEVRGTRGLPDLRRYEIPIPFRTCRTVQRDFRASPSPEYHSNAGEHPEREQPADQPSGLWPPGNRDVQEGHEQENPAQEAKCQAA